MPIKEALFDPKLGYENLGSIYVCALFSTLIALPFTQRDYDLTDLVVFNIANFPFLFLIGTKLQVLIPIGNDSADPNNIHLAYPLPS